MSDKIGRLGLLALGIVALIIADVWLAKAVAVWEVLVGSALWGLFLGMTQGLFSTLLADVAPEALRGTAFGVFNFLTGMGLLVASILAGWLWAIAGSAMTFYASAMIAALTLPLLLMFWYCRKCVAKT